MQEQGVRRSPGRPTEQESEAIRRNVLLAAIRIFAETGYEQTSMEMIAEAAGSTKTTMYRLFSSKDRLFVDAVSHVLERVRKQMPTLLVADREPRQVLIAFARTLIKAYRESGMGALWRTVLAVKSRFPDLYDAVQAEISPATVGSMLADYFAETNLRGVTRIPQTRLAADQFMVLIGPALELFERRHRSYDEDEWIDAVINMFGATYSMA
jgi:AcrR family transcriptional regulator